MSFKEVDIYDFKPEIFTLWDKKWFLLTCGDFEKGNYNTMTVAWGSFGIMWNKPFAQIVVRPTRYTYEFTEKYKDFTLTAFPDNYKEALKVLGTKSGRDGNKIKEAGLTPIKSKTVLSPSFNEANLILECKTIYFDDLKPENFLIPSIEKLYPKKDYHRIYFGEITTILQK